MRNLFNEFGGRAGPLLMLVAALAGFFFLLDLLVSLFSSGPPDLLAVNPSDDKTIGLPNGAGIFTFAIAAVAIIIGVVALASPQHWVLRRGVPRPRRSLAVGAVVALVVTGAGLYLAFSGLLDPEIPYEQHQAQRKWLEPAGLVVLAGFFLSVAIVGIVSPRFLLLPLAAWLAAAIVFGWLGSSALAGLSLIERPAKLETPSAYAAEVDRYRRTVDSSPTTIPWDVSIPLETGGAVLTRGDSQLLLVPGTTVLHTQNPVPNPLFTITGAAHTSFLRSATGDVYENGTWTQLDPVEVGIVPGVDVPGAVRDFIRAGMDEQLALLSPRRLELSLLGQPTVEPVTTRLDHITASPAGELKTFEAGLLPTSAVLQGVNIAGVFRPFSATFQNPESASSYAWDSKVAEFSQRQLIGAGPARDPTYLVLPADLPEGIRVLAQEITAGLESPYEKAKAIERHLRDEYSYRLPPGGEGQSLPPEGRDPVDWFLSEHHEGGSGSFSSAFVLLARAAGVPARVVSGWAIAPYEGTQTVHGDQAHQWGEIALEGVGWITFDPTPNGAPSRVRLLPVLDGPREEPEEPAAPAPQDEDSVLDTALVELATSPDPTVRAAAAGLLGEIGGDLPFAALVHAWSADPVRDVRRAAMESLAGWDLEELIRVLLEHDNPLMRTAAAHALGVRGDARALDALLAALAADEEAGVRGAAATALVLQRQLV